MGRVDTFCSEYTSRLTVVQQCCYRRRGIDDDHLPARSTSMSATSSSVPMFKSGRSASNVGIVDTAS